MEPSNYWISQVEVLPSELRNTGNLVLGLNVAPHRNCLRSLNHTNFLASLDQLHWGLMVERNYSLKNSTSDIRHSRIMRRGKGYTKDIIRGILTGIYLFFPHFSQDRIFRFKCQNGGKTCKPKEEFYAITRGVEFLEQGWPLFIYECLLQYDQEMSRLATCSNSLTPIVNWCGNFLTRVSLCFAM